MAESDPSGLVTDVDLVTNADAPWDSFDSQDYFSHNYGQLRKDDSRIIDIVADFFQLAGPKQWPADAIDVGTGANLYPALTLLPYATRVTLLERAFTNRQWLADELAAPQESWSQFWKVIADRRPAYQDIKDPFHVLAERAVIDKGSVFDLGPDQYDIGTMFFVAESITTKDIEFRRAARQFVKSLRRRAPFAAAFMSGSSGYLVGGQHFPACSVDEADVKECLAPLANIKHIETVESQGLRDGYCGMIVATGWKR